MLAQQVLEGEAAEQRVALDTPVGGVTTLDPWAVAVRDRPDPACRQQARIKRRGELFGDLVERHERTPLEQHPDHRADLRPALPAAFRHRRQPDAHRRLGRGRRAARWRRLAAARRERRLEAGYGGHEAQVTR